MLWPPQPPVHIAVASTQFIGRWRVEVDPLNPRAFEDTEIPVPNPDLDPLLQMHCSVSDNGRCAVPRDSMLVLPATRTRIALIAPVTQGLFAWNS